MRENLLGYVLGALDESEHENVRLHLDTDPRLQHDLRRLEARLTLLLDEADDFDPPDGLAGRACALVADHRASSAV